MAQLKDLIVAGPSRLIGDTILSAGAISEGDIIPSVSGQYLGASGKTWDGTYITKTTGAATGNYGDSGNQTPSYGSTFNVPYIQVDANGRISNISSHTVKIPATDNTATAADNILKGSNSGTQITYAPYTTQQSKLSFDTSTTAPSRTDRLNLNGYLYATKLYSNGSEVLTSHQSLSNYVTLDGAQTISGAKTFTAAVYINNTTDASGTGTTGGLIVGTKTAANVAIDDNEIMARNNSTVATLYINNDGGLVQIGTGGLSAKGTIQGRTIAIANTSDVQKAYWQYNSTDNSIDLIFN